MRYKYNCFLILVCNSIKSSCSFSRLIGSSALKGSSINITGGSTANALTTPTSVFDHLIIHLVYDLDIFQVLNQPFQVIRQHVDLYLLSFHFFICGTCNILF